MAFSLQGFGAGFASKLSQRLDEDRIRQEQLQDEARREATRVRLAKQAQREKDKKIAEETVGMLTMLGYSQESAQAIAGKGVAASEFAIEAGQKALTKGVDPNTIFNFPSVGGEITEAETGDIRELDAVYEILSWEDVTIVIEEAKEVKRTVFQPHCRTRRWGFFVFKTRACRHKRRRTL